MTPSGLLAYPVPFRLERLGAGRIRLTNRSDEALHSLVFLLDGPGAMRVRPAGRLPPGATVTLDVRGDDLPRRTAVVVRWARPDGECYLWRISF